MQTTSDEVTGKIAVALQKLNINSHAIFHPVQDIANEAQLSHAEVLGAVAGSDNFVLSSRTSSTGDRLVTTRDHYDRNASFGRKLLGAFTNRID
ncbi:hypothetical protein GCM10028822_32830 [Hymenobacter terrigena]